MPVGVYDHHLIPRFHGRPAPIATWGLQRLKVRLVDVLGVAGGELLKRHALQTDDGYQVIHGHLVDGTCPCGCRRDVLGEAGGVVRAALMASSSGLDIAPGSYRGAPHFGGSS